LLEHATALGHWHPAIASCPPSPPVPQELVASEDVPALQEAFDTFVAQVEAWWSVADPLIKQRLDQESRARTERTTEEEGLKALASQRSRLGKDVLELELKAQARDKRAQELDAEAATCRETVQKLDAALEPYASLDAEIATHTQARDGNKAGHEAFLKAKTLAEELEPRQEQLAERQQAETDARSELGTQEQAWALAQAAFSPAKLQAARDTHEKCVGQAKAVETKLEHAREELGKQDKRFEEWHKACQEQERVREQIAHCEAAIALTQLARKTLQSAAPAVAQHLCDRIAARAQSVFNQIHLEPVSLSWDAERYSLRITPGDRRFAMLSGGEQTKLALAMTLAMVEELSGLRFCIFDEPTYGVDADSRRKLADAVLAAQQAAGLEQLLLVSHDDAFEGKIEHAIVLSKSAAQGTVVLSP
jgi:DNA repair protein SbcC/Rad50